MKITFRVVIAVIVVVLAWYILADRLTPFTSNARVKAVVTPIVPKVSGTVIEVVAANSQLVEPGALLARLDRRPFEIARNRAQANPTAATQAAGANSAEVERAQAQLARAESDLDNVRLQSGRMFELERKGLVPVARADDARTKLSNAKASVEVAKAELERARQELGQSGVDNAQVQAALADLAEAELDLTYTELRAPSLGGVVDLNVAEGAQAKAGERLMMFVDARDVWIDAYLTENNIGRIEVGDPVDVVLDTHPGRIVIGRVESFTAAASLGNPPRDGLPRAPNVTSWLRDPQRFPVRVVLEGYEAGDPEDDLLVLLNGQADVIVYTGDNVILNAIGGAYIRVVSWLSYAY